MAAGQPSVHGRRPLRHDEFRKGLRLQVESQVLLKLSLRIAEPRQVGLPKQTPEFSRPAAGQPTQEL